MSIESFDEYFEGYKDYDDGGKLDQGIKDDLIKALDGVKYDKLVVLDMMDKHPDMVKTLVDAKDKERKPLFDALAIDDVLFNCKDTIERKPDVITATLDDPKAIDWIADWENRGAALWRLSGDPLSSTIEKNPQAFGIQPKDARITKDDLIKALDGVKYDKSVVLDMMDKHPDMVKTLVDAKDKEGKPLFDALAIDDVLFNCKDTIERKPDVITATLDDPKAIDWIADWENRGAALWRLSGDPLSSTIEKNPQAFGIQPKNEEIVKENNAGNTNDNKLAHLKKLIESRKMTKDIKRGMDKSTPIKQVDANAPFNVVATKTSKTSER